MRHVHHRPQPPQAATVQVRQPYSPLLTPAAAALVCDDHVAERAVGYGHRAAVLQRQVRAQRGHLHHLPAVRLHARHQADGVAHAEGPVHVLLGGACGRCGWGRGRNEARSGRAVVRDATARTLVKRTRQCRVLTGKDVWATWGAFTPPVAHVHEHHDAAVLHLCKASIHPPFARR